MNHRSSFREHTTNLGEFPEESTILQIQHPRKYFWGTVYIDHVAEVICSICGVDRGGGGRNRRTHHAKKKEY